MIKESRALMQVIGCLSKSRTKAPLAAKSIKPVRAVAPELKVRLVAPPMTKKIRVTLIRLPATPITTVLFPEAEKLIGAWSTCAPSSPRSAKVFCL